MKGCIKGNRNKASHQCSHWFNGHYMKKIFFCILQSVRFSRTLRTDIFLYTEKLSYVFLSLSATHIRHTCNVQWLTIFPLFINYSHFLKENGKYTQTELFVLQMKSFWIDLCCPNKDSDSVLLTIFSHFAANYLYSKHGDRPTMATFLCIFGRPP